MRQARPALSVVVLLAGCEYYAYDLVDPEPSNDPVVCAEGLAECDGNAITTCETRLASSPKHCGRCGHSCGDAACREGRCQALPLTSSAENRPSGLLVPTNAHGVNVFWANDGGRVVRRFDTRTQLTSDVATITRATEPASYEVRMDLTWNWIYWVNPSEGVLRRTGAVGGSAVDVIEAANVLDVATLGDFVVWLLADGTVKGYSPVQQTAIGVLGSAPGATRLEAGNEFFLLTPAGPARLAFRGGDTSTKALTPGPVSLSVVRLGSAGAVDLFWGTASGAIGRRDAALWDGDWSANPPVFTGFPNARAFTAETSTGGATTYYFVSSPSPSLAGEVWSVDPAVNGGRPLQVSDVPATDVVVDATHVYFSDVEGTAVFKVAK